jgi:putative oxidoreductase
VRRDLGLLLLRFSGVYIAWAHGFGKVVALASGEGDQFVAGVGELGFPIPVVFAWAAALAECVGGLFIALGLFTPIAAGLNAFTMAVAGFLRHKAHQLLLVNLGAASFPSDAPEGWGNPELAILYGLCFVAIALLGPGAWSIDHRWRRKRTK